MTNRKKPAPAADRTPLRALEILRSVPTGCTVIWSSMVRKSVFLDGTPALYVGVYVKNVRIHGHPPSRVLDGPFTAEGLREKLIGRVVGVLGGEAT